MINFCHTRSGGNTSISTLTRTVSECTVVLGLKLAFELLVRFDSFIMLSIFTYINEYANLFSYYTYGSILCV